jgi:hypothetical protein
MPLLSHRGCHLHNGVAVWGTVWFLAYWAYRRVRLLSIPWLAGYTLVHLALSLYPRILIRSISEGAQQRAYIQALGMSTEALLAVSQHVSISFGTLADGLIIALLVSELAYVLSTSSLAQGLQKPRALSLPRSHMPEFGIGLLAICFLKLMYPTAPPRPPPQLQLDDGY